MKPRKLPIGIQTFSELREGGYVYVDKTALVYEMANGTKYNFISRPRRFGKSMLLSTLRAYFEGRRELFDGLDIEKLETEWIKHPVLRFDLNNGEYQSEDGVYETLSYQLSRYEQIYGIEDSGLNTSSRFQNLISAAHEQTGQQVVILVDEYEKPILETIDNKPLQEKHRGYLKPFYSNIKSSDEHIRFVLLTGVTKMGHLSIFSDLNNICNLSLDKQFAAICGFTEDQITEYFPEYIERMSISFGVSKNEVIEMLRKKYDGYQFSKANIKVFNPFSLLNAFNKDELDNFWFGTGTPSFLIKVLRNNDFKLPELEGLAAQPEELTEVDDDYSSPVPLLYQSGYLTIKDYIPEDNEYILGYPNYEVRRGLFESLLPNYVNKDKRSARLEVKSIAKAVKAGDIEGFMQPIQSLIAGIPSSPREKYEYLYRDSIYLIFRVLGFSVDSEVTMLTGRVDCTVKTDDYVYVLEFKLDESAEAAISQIEENGYVDPYMASGKKVFKVGVNVDSTTRKMQWIIK